MKNEAAGSWLSQIEGARSSRDLVGVLRDFLGSMKPDELGELPDACRAENISTGPEIQEWAVTLAREDLKAVPERILHPKPKRVVEQIPLEAQPATVRVS